MPVATLHLQSSVNFKIIILRLCDKQGFLKSIFYTFDTCFTYNN